MLQVTSESDVNAALDIAASRFGKLNAVVNCAGTAVAFQTYNFSKHRPHELESFTNVQMVCAKRYLAYNYKIYYINNILFLNLQLIII